MTLDQIINFDAAISALSEVDDFVQPFEISDNGVRHYRLLKQQLEMYLLKANDDEMGCFLNNFEFTKEFCWLNDKKVLLRILLRLHNFHLFTVLEFETTEGLRNFVSQFIVWFERYLNDINHIYDDKFLVAYIKFSLHLSLQSPRIKELEANDLSDSSKARLSIHHYLKIPSLSAYPSGLFYPFSKPRMLGVSNIRISKQQILKVFSLVHSSFLNLTGGGQRDIQTIVDNDLLQLPLLICHLMFYALGEERSIFRNTHLDFFYFRSYAIGSSKNTELLKPLNFKDLVYNYYTFGLTDDLAKHFVVSFSYILKRLLKAPKSCAVISDYLSTFIIDFSNFELGPCKGLDSYKSIRKANCNIYQLDWNSPYSLSTQLFCFFYEVRSNYIQREHPIRTHQDNFVEKSYSGINKVHDQIIQGQL